MKLRSSWQPIAEESRLQIREMAGVLIGESGRLPFSCEIRSNLISIKIPAYAKLLIREGWQWVTVHDGQQWGALGVTFPESNLEFQVPLNTELRINAQGRNWLVRTAPVVTPARKRTLKEMIGESSYLGLSLFCHLNLFLLLWWAVQQNFNFGINERPELISKEEKQKVVEQAKAAGQAGGGAIEWRPFEGMTFTEFGRRLEAAKREANPLGYLAQSLNRMKGQGAGNMRGAGVQSATGAIGTGSGAGGGTALSDTIANQKFEVASSGGNNVTKLSDKQKLALRDKIRDLQDDFKRIYSRMLSQDPNLSVTVNYQAKVTASGYLELNDFKARGTYAAGTLPQLKTAMADVIRSVYVGPELSGLTLRAESVFVR